MKKIAQFIFNFILLLILVAPVLTLAQDPIGNCTYPAGGTASGYTKSQCDKAKGKWVQTSTTTTTSATSSTDTKTSSTSKNLIPCGTSVNTKECDFKDLLTLVNNVITFILVDLALPIAALMFAYAGAKLVLSGGSPEARTSAKTIALNTVIGIVLAAGSWIIVKTFLAIMGYQGSGYL